MALLSAFDEGYPTYIRTGWELDLFFDREKVLKERRQRISEITEIFLDDPTQQEDEIKKLLDTHGPCTRSAVRGARKKALLC